MVLDMPIELSSLPGNNEPPADLFVFCNGVFGVFISKRPGSKEPPPGVAKGVPPPRT